MERSLLSTDSLVKDRTCGTCTVCCYVPFIDTPELKKPAGVVCPNCTGRGCGIYETRPQVCRDYYCGWRYTAQLGDDWRPDKSGVFIGLRKDKVPEGYSGPWGWQLQLLAGEIAIGRHHFVDAVIQLVERRVPTFLSASGPMGTPFEVIFINEILADAVRRRDRAGVFAILVASHRELMKFPSMAEVRNASAGQSQESNIRDQT